MREQPQMIEEMRQQPEMTEEMPPQQPMQEMGGMPEMPPEGMME
jgi:hypothetical protein